MVDWRLILLLLLLGLMWLVYTRLRCPRSAAPSRPVSITVHRRLKPRTPDDCPACRQQQASPLRDPPRRAPVRPWGEIRSRRGAPKQIDTAGFACPNPGCPYYGNPDARVHALVGDGTHGQRERIQTFRCQACGVTFSARRNTPLYQLKTSSGRIAEVLTALAEGLDVAAAVRVFGHREATIAAWLRRAGQHGEALHDRGLRHLRLPQLQLDEIRTRLRRRDRVLWLWLALDPVSKRIPVLQLGPRTQVAAHAVVPAVRQQLAPGCLPVFTSDGLTLYYYALTAHFGAWIEEAGRRTPRWQVAPGLVYGQVQKAYRQRKRVRVRHRMLVGTREHLQTRLQQLGLSGKLNTAFVERVNLTLRQSVAALLRRTWSTAQETAGLRTPLQWWRAYYHFVRPHASLRVALPAPQERGGRRLPQRYRQRTPAMAAGLTSRRWTVGQLLAWPVVPEVGVAA